MRLNKVALPNWNSVELIVGFYLLPLHSIPCKSTGHSFIALPTRFRFPVTVTQGWVMDFTRFSSTDNFSSFGFQATGCVALKNHTKKYAFSYRYNGPRKALCFMCILGILYWFSEFCYVSQLTPDHSEVIQSNPSHRDIWHSFWSSGFWSPHWWSSNSST